LKCRFVGEANTATAASAVVSFIDLTKKQAWIA
jgi:hypothetical protein